LYSSYIWYPVLQVFIYQWSKQDQTNNTKTLRSRNHFKIRGIYFEFANLWYICFVLTTTNRPGFLPPVYMAALSIYGWFVVLWNCFMQASKTLKLVIVGEILCITYFNWCWFLLSMSSLCIFVIHVVVAIKKNF